MNSTARAESAPPRRAKNRKEHVVRFFRVVRHAHSRGRSQSAGFVTEADLASETPLWGAPRSGRIVGRRPIMGQGGSKIPGGKRRPGPGAREAAVKLDEIDEEDLDSLSDEDLDLLLAAEADLAVQGPDDRATGADASSTAAAGAQRAARSIADSSGEARGDGGHTEGALGGQGSGPAEASASASATTPTRSSNPHVSSLGADGSRSKRAAAGAALAAASLEASSELVKQSLAVAAAASAGALRRARARPARAARVVAGGLCGGVAKAVAHALLVASAECFAPTRVALAGVRVGSALVAGGAGFRAASSLRSRGSVARLPAAKITSAPVAARRAAARALDAVSPVPASALRAACAPALAVVARRATVVCTAYLRNALRLRLASRAGAAVAPIKTRQLSYATRVAPVVGAYACLLYTSPSPRDKRQSRMPSSA